MLRRWRESDPENQLHRLAQLTTLRFQRAVNAADILYDDAQEEAIAQLLTAPTHGFYLWGSAGRGKSMLADLYYDAAPTAHKKRFHFHRFFHDLHTEIVSTRQSVEKSISRIIGSAQIVLFDEFHVHDVGDAVFLTKALEAIFKHKILMLATSNYEPEKLMPNPLFHDRFLPAITLIKSQFRVVEIGNGTDYRKAATVRGRTGFGRGSWLISKASSAAGPSSDVDLNLNGLTVRAVTAVDDTVTVTFTELCDRPLMSGHRLARHACSKRRRHRMTPLAP